MFFWKPTIENTETWQPIGGWNSAFTEEDKIQCTNLFFFFKDTKGFKENMSQSMANMTIFKQKYQGMKYSDEQEALLLDAMKPVFNHSALSSN
jgi:hypothetical protein